MIRIGIGYDIHRLVHGRKLFLGGIIIPSKRGLLGHSDGDVLLHAICDALLGAMGQEDIGEHFPDHDPKYKGISSLKLLKQVTGLLRKRNLQISNLDTIIIIEEPKLSAYKEKILKSIARALKIKESCLNIKAKTNEGLGAIGRKEAIACYAAVTIISKEGKR
ncbi:2-C-methyl-D-erythritol 2,4-cyclodiphosphate synthase [bacterium]|nr:MAG: 2-C-methyl-D-erythritol 2,4-cyclodiphosphate synthase [bacterium]